MSGENEDVLYITERDLCPHNQKKCHGVTIKGKSCRNKVYKEYDYCKTHYEKFRLEKPEDCPICMESLENVKIPLSCSHWVHRDCIIKWGKNKCPICTANIKLTKSEIKKMRRINKENDNEENENIILPNVLYYRIEDFLEMLLFYRPINIDIN